MKVLIDIGHPAHVHLFKHFAWEMQENGHSIFFTCREKEFEIDLLNHYGFNFKSFGRKYKTTFGKILGLIEFDIKEFLAGLKFKPDLFLSHGSVYAAHASFLMKRPHISLEDTFNFEQVKLYLPFTDAVLTADYDHLLKSEKVIRYSGYHELAYLHPNRFRPDKSILKELGVTEDEKYVIMRFVSWKASHDIGHKGISFENKIKAVNEFSKYAKVFISSESEQPKDLEKFRITIPPYRIHDAMSFATMFFGESFTMSAEATILGVPSIIIHNNIALQISDMESKYDLCFKYSESEEDQKLAINKGIELLNTPHIKDIWAFRRNKMLSEKIDVTEFLVWFVENWPESSKIMKENLDYQLNF